MNQKRWTILLFAVLILAVIFIYQYYTSNYTNEGIADKVLNQDGYTVTLRSEHIPVEIFVKPEWITFKVNDPMKQDIRVAELHNSNLLLDVLNRGSDIYFTFKTTFNMENPSGVFIYNGIFHEDGISTYSSANVRLFDKNMREFSVGQTGVGPGASFSFGIDPEEQKLIREGFYVKYDDFNVYNYVKDSFK
ncbi:hypothetical protein [Paenibacillus illinoisensis]|uniref:hypothetical protein n=1 Tax=Paenibacillus illinoisensis TaxID=59845 RepID=UPI0036F390B5